MKKKNKNKVYFLKMQKSVEINYESFVQNNTIKESMLTLVLTDVEFARDFQYFISIEMNNEEKTVFLQEKNRRFK